MSEVCFGLTGMDWNGMQKLGKTDKKGKNFQKKVGGEPEN
jgi:hypothetical protein